MKKEKSSFAKFFSLSRHQKRKGGDKLISQLVSVDYEAMKNNLINDAKLKYTHGADKDLQTHIEHLRHEFSGQSELVYHHAKLIVLIRRESNLQQSLQSFFELWDQQGDFLRQHLNIRWLISAIDTFIDHSSDPTTQALGLLVPVMMNTIKLHETERLLQESKDAADSDEIKATLQSGRVDLFSGMSCFAVGTDDTIRNMRWRIDRNCQGNPAGEIFLEIFERIQGEDTVYGRFKKRHVRDRTGWWN
ncbi:hypothetical protein [Pelagibaculum spongiae]|uniref:Uncharacterized protein n=1 Tax=Pelagibaculum spongiae TaxID=2080658 RepID=A0A2V1GUY7_9GAMM|nr:hypothetical protein [Pelagibaculum spongiae]PVZ70215.1 hypothetical protein DC094_06320 [Pelagibaculum spongiae]